MEVTPPEGTFPTTPPGFLHVLFQPKQESLRTQQQNLGKWKVPSAVDARPTAPYHRGTSGTGRSASPGGKGINVGEASSGKNRYLAH